MDLRKVYAIAIALSKSQLRTSTSGRRTSGILRRPSIIFILDAVAFGICAVLGYLGVTALQTFYPSGAASPDGQGYTAVVGVIKEALIFVPTFVPSGVLLGGILFELNISSKFAASDTVNWLPVTQTEYVAASATSVAYNYSLLPVIFLGILLEPAVYLGYGDLWAAAALLSVLGLMTGGVLVEILRATVNRVSSIVTKHARRGAFVLRLALLVVIIVVIDTSFNPSILIGTVNSLSGSLTVAPLIPILWGSIIINSLATGDLPLAAAFSVGTVVFSGVLLWVAVTVRSRYWSPMVGSVSLTTAEYRPRSGTLVKFGLTSGEAAIVRKDLKGVTRRRELITFFAVPIVFVAIFLIDGLGPGSSGTGPSSGIQIVLDLPIFLAGTIFALMISSLSFGQESKSVMVLYSLPISPDQILKAKAFVALLFSLTATVATFIVFSIVSGEPVVDLVENLLFAVAITIEEVFIGLAFGAAHPDFQERPRPRFVDPYWLIVMLVVGFVVALVSATPLIIRDLLAVSLSSGTTPFYLFPAGLAFASAVTVFTYRRARSIVRNLMAEYRI